MSWRQFVLIIITCVVGGLAGMSATAARAAKTTSTFYPAQARANARANAAKYAWARKQVEDAVAAAKPWVETSDDELWSMIIPPKLQRAIMVNVNKGCPNCGMAMYGERGPRPYAWIAWVPGHPWKVQCPNCKELFPKNDFGAFYKSAIDPATGLFDPALGDRSLLFNTDHPDPNDPLHMWGVDDGSGWPRFGDDPTQRDFYIGYHVYFGRNGRATAAMRTLALAYALTGKPIYAHKCAILLDRLADVYPDYNGADQQLFNNVWGRYSEGIVGPNYWAGGAWAQRAIDYDMIYDGIGMMPETLAFVQAKAHRYRVPMPKDSIADVRSNIEERVLSSMFQHRDRIAMNGTITEMCMAKVDLVLRGPAALDDFVTKDMPAIVPPQNLNPDGSGNEQSTGYDAGAFGEYCSLLSDLAGLSPEVAKAAIEGYPAYRAAFDFWPDIWCLGKFIPQIGDVGEPGAQTGLEGSPQAYLAMYQITGEPRYAQIALRMVDGDASRLPRNIFAADPEGLVKRAVAASKAAGPWQPPSVVKPDYGLGILRSGSGDGRQALWLHYSPKAGTSSHSHFDALNFGLYAFGLSLVCEHGYPLYTGGWPARWQWTSHTRSHSTVTVDGQCQKQCDDFKLLGFARDGNVQMISAEAPCAYDNVSRYRRTMLTVEVAPDQAFIVDVFRVRGGREHNYGVLMFYGDSTAGGLTMSPHPDLYDGYLRSVQAAPAAGAWWVDTAIRSAWQGKVAAHLRIHGTASDATVMTGHGESRWGRDDPRWLPYLIIQRRSDGAELDSTFVVVYEPYATTPFLADHPLTATVAPDHVNLEVQFAGGGPTYSFVVEDGAPDWVSVTGNRRGGAAARTFMLAGIAPDYRLK
jgi:hypothetical protein